MKSKQNVSICKINAKYSLDAVLCLELDKLWYAVMPTFYLLHLVSILTACVQFNLFVNKLSITCCLIGVK